MSYKDKMSSFKKSAKKGKKKVLTAWIDESSDQEMKNLCLMAKEDDEVSSNTLNLSSSKFSLNGLDDTFNELIEDFEK